ncbi:MAG: CPBP family intramembrane metalloprotease [Bacteroidia bacterium]|nr:CPBP family intramembrane metalloprotease [Bacteroidia bacterium]MBT8288287.1 CPBP family intramembrane metalloprotease [Bacteroidia bacterium]
MKSVRYKAIELFLIFVLAPISFTIAFPIWIKIALGLVGFVYVVYVLLRIERLPIRPSKNLKWKSFWKQTFLHLMLIALITISYVWFTEADQLFRIMLEKSKLWILILFVYSLFSVYPQELIYRTFFFHRYEDLIHNKRLFLLVNAALFSLAHIFFRNALVMGLTFIGGLLFALTFQRTRSTLMVSIEHAIYGCWLFTVGMGEMLGFPS